MKLSVVMKMHRKIVHFRCRAPQGVRGLKCHKRRNVHRIQQRPGVDRVVVKHNAGHGNILGGFPAHNICAILVPSDLLNVLSYFSRRLCVRVGLGRKSALARVLHKRRRHLICRNIGIDERGDVLADLPADNVGNGNIRRNAPSLLQRGLCRRLIHRMIPVSAFLPP